jgi:hypothetical protein
MNLVDDSGCPVNELIFPALQLEDGTRSVILEIMPQGKITLKNKLNHENPKNRSFPTTL